MEDAIHMACIYQKVGNLRKPKTVINTAFHDHGDIHQGTALALK
jgi:hypothetical protein